MASTALLTNARTRTCSSPSAAEAAPRLVLSSNQHTGRSLGSPYKGMPYSSAAGQERLRVRLDSDPLKFTPTRIDLADWYSLLVKNSLQWANDGWSGHVVVSGFSVLSFRLPTYGS